VSPLERHLTELSAALHTRGRVRRRFLRECEDHLRTAAAERGEAEAVRAFGPACEIAAAFDAEVAGRRSVWAALLAVAGVLAVGGSTLALIHAASPAATPAIPWAVAFFVAAQLAGVAAALALLQALAMRREQVAPGDVLLLVRRSGVALLAAAAAELSAGGAVAGKGSALLLLAGPALAVAAGVAVLRVRRLARQLAAAGGARPLRPPLEDLGMLAGVHLPAVEPSRLLPLVTALAMAAAFVRDRAEQGTAGQALLHAGVEGVAVVACFIALGPVLGLRRRVAELAT